MISVIIPVYNVEKYLNECMYSVVNSTYTDLEIILVDDGSTDKSSQMCDDWAKKDSRIKVIHQKNQGLSAARNAAIEIATGEYISFVDSDDFISTDLYGKAMDAFSTYDIDAFCFDFLRVGENGKPFKNEDIYPAHCIVDMQEAMRRLFVGEIGDYACNKIFKSELFDDVKFPVGKVFEDAATMYKIIQRVDNLYITNDRLYCYRLRTDSIVGEMKDSSLIDLFYARKAKYEDVRKIFPEIAETGFGLLTQNAQALYDRGLWSNVEDKALSDVNCFFDENREKILSLENKKLTFFIKHPKMYRFLRITKHRIGTVVKAIKKLKKN